MHEVLIFTDGSCLVNPGGPGGWAAILRLAGKTAPEKELSGSDPSTTNNRMELQAAIEGLRALQHPCLVEIVTDSQYLCGGFGQGWVSKWKAFGWKTGKHHNKPVMNEDLWRELDRLVQIHTVRWTHVRGHQDNPDNNRCDVLAGQAARALQAVLAQEKADEQAA